MEAKYKELMLETEESNYDRENIVGDKAYQSICLSKVKLHKIMND